MNSIDCPPEFLNTDIDKLRCKKATETALKWNFGARGLIFHGPTGMGKTRTAWLIATREALAGRTIKAISAIDFSFKLPGLYVRGAENVADWLDELCRADLLILDDIFKAVLTDRTEAFLLALLTSRVEWGLPIITTLTDTSETLAYRLSFERGPSILRRLKEYATPISFT